MIVGVCVTVGVLVTVGVAVCGNPVGVIPKNNTAATTTANANTLVLMVSLLLFQAEKSPFQPVHWNGLKSANPMGDRPPKGFYSFLMLLRPHAWRFRPLALIGSANNLVL